MIFSFLYTYLYYDFSLPLSFVGQQEENRLSRMEWSGMASPRQQQSQQDPIELQEHERGYTCPYFED